MIGDCPSYFACVRLEIIGERYAVVLSKGHDPIPQGVIREPRARHEEWKVLRLRARTFVYEPYDTPEIAPITHNLRPYLRSPTPAMRRARQCVGSMALFGLITKRNASAPATAPVVLERLR